MGPLKAAHSRHPGQQPTNTYSPRCASSRYQNRLPLMKIGIRAEPMGAPPSAALHPESDIRARIPPEMSNYYCHPGKAGGSPLDFSVRMLLASAPGSIDDEQGGLGGLRKPSSSHRLGQRAGPVRQARAARIWRQMGLDPGVRRRWPPVPDLLWRAGEDEFIGLAARSAEQALLVPFDPDVPVFIPGERRFQTLPIFFPPVRGALAPERQLRQLARA